MLEDTLLQGGLWFIKAALLLLLFFVLKECIKKIMQYISDKMIKHGASQSLVSIVTWIVENALVIYVFFEILLVLELLKAATIAPGTPCEQLDVHITN